MFSLIVLFKPEDKLKPHFNQRSEYSEEILFALYILDSNPLNNCNIITQLHTIRCIFRSSAFVKRQFETLFGVKNLGVSLVVANLL